MMLLLHWWVATTMTNDRRGLAPRRSPPLPTTTTTGDDDTGQGGLMLLPVSATSSSSSSHGGGRRLASGGGGGWGSRRPKSMVVVVLVCGLVAVLVLSSWSLMGAGPLASAALELGLWEPHGMMAQCPVVLPEVVPVEVREQRVFFAANMKDNDAIMDNFNAQLLQVVRVFRRERVFVSIYESNSRDGTPSALLSLAQSLQALDVPHRILTSQQDRKQPGEHRISFLARMRNKALEPMLDEAVQVRAGGAFHSLVFINDVYFCAWQVLRLLSYGADLSCGLDFKKASFRDQVWRMGVTRQWTGNRFYDIWVSRDEQGHKFQEDPPIALHYNKQQPPQGSSSRGQGMDQKEAEPPPGGGGGGGHGVVVPKEAFGAYCCWNGMAVLKAEPFYSGVRFRSAEPPLPIESECSLLCDDLWATAAQQQQQQEEESGDDLLLLPRPLRVVVDPAVKLSYDPRTYMHMQASFPSTTTTDHQATNNRSPAAADLIAPPHRLSVPGAVPLPLSVTSCPLAATATRVDYSQCMTRPPLLHAHPAATTTPKHFTVDPENREKRDGERRAEGGP